MMIDVRDEAINNAVQNSEGNAAQACYAPACTWYLGLQQVLGTIRIR